MILRADETVHATSVGRLATPPGLIDLTTSRDADSRGAASEHRARGQRVHLPLELHAAQQWSAQWLVPLGGANDIVGPTGLTAAETLPGRGLLTITYSRVLDGTAGRYVDLRVGVQVRRHDSRSAARGRALLDRAVEHQGQFIVDHVVTQPDFATDAREVWGTPTRCASLEVVPQGDRTSCTLLGPLGHELTVAIGEGGPLPPSAGAASIYTWRDGTLRMTSWQATRLQGGRRPGGATLVVARSGRLASLLRSFGLPKRALSSTAVSQLRAVIDAPCVVVPG